MTDDASAAEQTNALRLQLQALDALPRSRRRAWIHHEIRCKDCGDPVIQVMDTRPYRTVRSRKIIDGRLDKRWMFVPIHDDDAGADNEWVFAGCRCRSHEFTMKDILGRPGRSSTT